MNPKELRPGNLVQDEDNRGVLEVLENRGDLFYLKGESPLYYHLWLRELRPIPLTPEVLEGCGFCKSEAYNKYILDVSGLYFKWVYPILRIGQSNDWLEIINPPLHRLQNIILDLTSEELDVSGVKNLKL